MSKRPKNRRSSPRPHSPRGAAFGTGSTRETTDEPELHLDIERLLDVGSPLDLLIYASTLVASLEPEGTIGMSRPDLPSLPSLIAMFREVGLRATDALLLILTAFHGDDVLARRVASEVTARRHPLPAWLTQLDRFRPARVAALGHVLGDGESIVIGLDTPVGEVTFVFFIDHNQGTVVKDAYPLDASFTHITERLAEMARTEPGTMTIELSLADARARLKSAIDLGRTMIPPFETDSWPAVRSIAEWMLRLLPAGGVGYPEVDDLLADLDASAIVDQIADSASSADFDGSDGSDDRDIAETLLDFAASYFAGDPLRWSPITVEILLADVFPRRVHADAQYLDRVPDVMRTVIAFAHATKQVPPSLTLETLEAVDRFESEYRLLTRAAYGDDSTVTRPFDLGDPTAYYTASLAAACGGVEAIESLDLSPLPDEPVRLDDIELDIRERVAAVAALAGDTAIELFDPELRTVVHRVVARIAASDPKIFRRQSKIEMTAAAALWISCTANGGFHDVTVKAMMTQLGLAGSPAQRAEPMLRALGVDQVSGWTYDATLGDPALLTSDRRRYLADQWAWANQLMEHLDHE